jgi:ribosomal protein L37AE/L43A
MASPIAIAAALAGVVKVTCPHCGNVMAVKRRARAKPQVCRRCKKTFATGK